ncbi:hypothetical protein WMY93_009232 [Mugilogobius chulae]|uniref:HAT C-terminal dimerisation domain-containing protein n=1 Tax=Mugilogobius chulae TaxID=88201 RepID=A0AAW0PEU3_9GOBI
MSTRMNPRAQTDVPPVSSHSLANLIENKVIPLNNNAFDCNSLECRPIIIEVSVLTTLMCRNLSEKENNDNLKAAWQCSLHSCQSCVRHCSSCVFDFGNGKNTTPVEVAPHPPDVQPAFWLVFFPLLSSRVHNASITAASKDLSGPALVEWNINVGLPEHTLILDVRTRWNSLYLMIERFMEQYLQFKLQYENPQLRKTKKQIIRLRNEDFHKAEEFIQVMKVLYTLCVSGENFATLPTLQKLEKHIIITEEDTGAVDTVGVGGFTLLCLFAAGQRSSDKHTSGGIEKKEREKNPPASECQCGALLKYFTSHDDDDDDDESQPSTSSSATHEVTIPQVILQPSDAEPSISSHDVETSNTSPAAAAAAASSRIQQDKEVFTLDVLVDAEATVEDPSSHQEQDTTLDESTGEHLASMILKKLQEFGIAFENCRGQAYDNGANMRGKNKGVQARLLQLNPRALFVPCGAHTLNLVVADAAKKSRDAINYFGILQKLYTLFSASTNRWTILKKHVDITLKMWTDTRWESKIKSVEPMRFKAADVRNALIEIRDGTKDPVIKTEAQSLSEEVGSYRVSICTVVWFDILSKIHHVSKLMQSPSMQVDIAVGLLRKTESALQSYRATGFVSAQTSVKTICEEMNVEAVLQMKRLRSTKRHFTYESFDEPISDALKKLEVEFFNAVVDCAVSSIQERFTTLQAVGDKFGVLSNFQNLTEEALTEQCKALDAALQHNGQSDVDGGELKMEMKNLPELPKKTMSQLELLSFIHDTDLTEIYPNLWTAQRVAVTLPVTVAEAERSFSKLKLIKTYLRSTMSQERLSCLAIISINHTIAAEVSYDDVIDDFALKKARREDLIERDKEGER